MPLPAAATLARCRRAIPSRADDPAAAGGRRTCAVTTRRLARVAAAVARTKGGAASAAAAARRHREQPIGLGGIVDVRRRTRPPRRAVVAIREESVDARTARTAGAGRRRQHDRGTGLDEAPGRDGHLLEDGPPPPAPRPRPLTGASPSCPATGPSSRRRRSGR